MNSDLLRGCPRFARLYAQALRSGPLTAAVAGASEHSVVAGLKDAIQVGLVRPVLVGNGQSISGLLSRLGIESGLVEVVDSTEAEAGLSAAEMVRDGHAQVLMKGMISSGQFLRAVLDRKRGLRGEGLLSHVAVYDGPSCPRLWLMSDGGLNVAPDLSHKRSILANAVQLARALGIPRPRIAVISASERPDPAMPSTLDAVEIVSWVQAGHLGEVSIVGPVALDIALSAEAARQKGVTGDVPGATDIFLMPGIEAGNVLGKSMMYLAGATMAGVVMGARAPVLLNSRADTASGRLATLAVAARLVRGGE